MAYQSKDSLPYRWDEKNDVTFTNNQLPATGFCVLNSGPNPRFQDGQCKTAADTDTSTGSVQGINSYTNDPPQYYQSETVPPVPNNKVDRGYKYSQWKS